MIALYDTGDTREERTMSDYKGSDGYQDYIPTAKDPGPSMLIATLLVCFISLALLPCLYSISNKRLQRRRVSEQPSTSMDSSGIEQPATAQQQQQSRLSSEQERQPGKASSASPDNGAANDRAVPRHPEPGATISDDDGGPRANNLPRRRARKARRAAHQKEEQNENNGDGAMVACSTGQGGRDDSMSSAPGRLDDAMGNRDAMGSRESSFSRDARDFMEDKEPATKQSCCSRISSAFHKLLIIAEWNDESRRICKLGVPYVTEEVVEGISDLARTAIVGQFISTPALEVWLIVDSIVGLFTGFLDGYIEALAMHCSHAIGAGNKKLAGQFVQLAVLFLTVGYIPIFIFWSFYVGGMVRWFGFGEETVAIADDYLPLFLLAEYLESFDECVHELLDVIGFAKYSTIFGCIQELVGLLGLLAVGLLSNDRTLQLVGLTEIAELAVGLVVNVLIITSSGWFDPYLEGLVGRFAVLVRTLSERHIAVG